MYTGIQFVTICGSYFFYLMLLGWNSKSEMRLMSGGVFSFILSVAEGGGWRTVKYWEYVGCLSLFFPFDLLYYCWTVRDVVGLEAGLATHTIVSGVFRVWQQGGSGIGNLHTVCLMIFIYDHCFQSRAVQCQIGGLSIPVVRLEVVLTPLHLSYEFLELLRMGSSHAPVLGLRSRYACPIALVYQFINKVRHSVGDEVTLIAPL